MAADPMNAVLLLGLGISDFSLSAPSIPAVKDAIRKVSLASAREIAEKVLLLESSEEIRNCLKRAAADLNL
jgi:phosphotransferase system, enzyme I, PtsP